MRHGVRRGRRRSPLMVVGDLVARALDAERARAERGPRLRARARGAAAGGVDAAHEGRARAARPSGVRAPGVLRQHHGHGLRRADGRPAQQRGRELRAAQGLVGAARSRPFGRRRRGRTVRRRRRHQGRLHFLAVAAGRRRHVEHRRLRGLRAVALERLRGARAGDAGADRRGRAAPGAHGVERRHDVLRAGAARQRGASTSRRRSCWA